MAETKTTQTKATSKDKKLTLQEKMLKIADMAGVLQKTKEGYGYKYVPEEDIQAKVTAGLQKYRVNLFCQVIPGTKKVTPITYEKFDKKLKANKTVSEVIVEVELLYTWVDVDNPEDKIESPWTAFGQMEDAAQAFGAALTYANRYYLMKTLQLATSESDPDNYRSKQKEAEDFEAEQARKEEEAAVDEARKRVIAVGSSIIALNAKDTEGNLIDRNTVMKIIGKSNDGNGNPNAIKDLNTLVKVEAELTAFEKSLTDTAKTKKKVEEKK